MLTTIFLPDLAMLNKDINPQPAHHGLSFLPARGYYPYQLINSLKPFQAQARQNALGLQIHSI